MFNRSEASPLSQCSSQEASLDLCWSLAMHETSFVNSFTPRLKSFESLFTAISCPSNLPTEENTFVCLAETKISHKWNSYPWDYWCRSSSEAAFSDSIVAGEVLGGICNMCEVKSKLFLSIDLLNLLTEKQNSTFNSLRNDRKAVKIHWKSHYCFEGNGRRYRMEVRVLRMLPILSNHFSLKQT